MGCRASRLVNIERFWGSGSPRESMKALPPFPMPCPTHLFHLAVPEFCPSIILSFSHSVVSDSLWPHGLQHARLPCPSLSPRVCSNMSIELVMPSNHLIHDLLIDVSLRSVSCSRKLIEPEEGVVGTSDQWQVSQNNKWQAGFETGI